MMTVFKQQSMKYKLAPYLAALFPVFCQQLTRPNVSVQSARYVEMTDHCPAGWPASLHDAHFSHGLVRHHDLCAPHVIVLREEFQELLDVNRTVSGCHTKCHRTANAIAVLNK